MPSNFEYNKTISDYKFLSASAHMEVEQPKEVHVHVRVAPRPHIHQHDREGLSKEQQVHEKCEELGPRQGKKQLLTLPAINSSYNTVSSNLSS